MGFRENPTIERLESALIDLHHAAVAVCEAEAFARQRSPHEWIGEEMRRAVLHLARVKQQLVELRWPAGGYSAGKVKKEESPRWTPKQ